VGFAVISGDQVDVDDCCDLRDVQVSNDRLEA